MKVTVLFSQALISAVLAAPVSNENAQAQQRLVASSLAKRSGVDPKLDLCCGGGDRGDRGDSCSGRDSCDSGFDRYDDGCEPEPYDDYGCDYRYDDDWYDCDSYGYDGGYSGSDCGRRRGGRDDCYSGYRDDGRHGGYQDGCSGGRGSCCGGGGGGSDCELGDCTADAVSCAGDCAADLVGSAVDVASDVACAGANLFCPSTWCNWVDCACDRRLNRRRGRHGNRHSGSGCGEGRRHGYHGRGDRGGCGGRDNCGRDYHDDCYADRGRYSDDCYDSGYDRYDKYAF